MNHMECMKLDIEIAGEALDQGELPIASVLVLGEEVIATGITTEVRDRRFLVHAELNTLLKADQLNLRFSDRRKSRLYTNLEPCMMCLGASMSWFLGEVYFSLESPGDGAVEMAKGWARNEEDMPSYKLPKIEGGLLREESIDLFKKYIEKHNSGPMWEWAKTLASL